MSDYGEGLSEELRMHLRMSCILFLPKSNIPTTPIFSLHKKTLPPSFLITSTMAVSPNSTILHTSIFFFLILPPFQFSLAYPSPPSSPPSFDPHFSRRRLLQASDDQIHQLDYDFYRFSCPNAETVAYRVTRDAVSGDSKVTARLLRMMFHDCFIKGCDASMLVDDSHGNQSHPIERNSVPNQTVKAFDVIDRIKDALEAECPGVVSCADIITLATRNSIVLSGGPFFPVLTGRRDSLESFYDDSNREIPSSDSDIASILNLFSQRGFNEKETVSLLGAHNIGKIGCEFILKRLFNFHGTGKADPTIPVDFIAELNNICSSNASPSPSPSRLRNLIESTTGMTFFESLAPFIFSGAGFDTHYYKSLLLGRGLLHSDQQLMADPKTAKLVEAFASDDGSTFRREFSRAMLKMSNLVPPAGSQVEVRTRCSLPNGN